jgi:peptide/nickel transport system substrate-binding protein
MSKESPNSGGVLRVGLDWEVDIVDPPASFGGWNTARVVQQIFESLVEDDLQDEASACTRLVPALARRYKISSDGLTYTFFLRENIQFHDGAPFDADAVKYNIERLWRHDAPQYYPIAADYNQVALQSLADIRVVDQFTIALTLHEPYADFLRYMTQEDAPGAMVFISPDAIEKFGNAGVADRAPGTGPFKFAERFSTPSGTGVSLVRNDDYWGGAPYLDGIRFIPIPDAEDRAQALLNGEIDLAYGPEPTSLEELHKKDFIIREGPVPYVWYFIFNMRDAHIRDIRVRRAIALAFDRQRLSREVFANSTRVTTGIVPPACPSYEPDFPDYYPYDPKRAAALLAEAGFGNGFGFRIMTATAGSAQLAPLKICEYLKRDLAEIGISLEVVPHRDWVSYCNEWRLGVPEGIGGSEMSWGMSCDVWLEQVAHSKYMSPKGFNAGYYSRAEVDRLLDLARTELHQTRRIELYRIAHRLIMDDLPLLPVVTMRSGAVVYSPRVKNFRFPAQNWHDFKRVWLETPSSQARLGGTPRHVGPANVR